MANRQVLCVAGASSTGKTASLANLPNQEGVWYLNCEGGGKSDLPFPNSFTSFVITDPYQVYDAIEAAESKEHVHTIVVDSITFMMDMFETQYVIGSANGMKGWSDYNQFFKVLMQEKIANSTKNIILIAHTLSNLNEQTMSMETKIPVKGALKNQGIESYMTAVVYTKRMPLKDLKDYDNPLLVINEEEEIVGVKHVFQTRVTKNTVNDSIRSPRFMWSIKETFIDNDVTKVFNRFKKFYA